MAKLEGTDGLHFVSVPYPPQLIEDYYPSALTHDDYPNLIPAGQSVDTIAVSAVLIAYNWPKTSVDRYRRVQRFVEAFFPKIAEFRKAPRHSKWQEVNIAAKLPGWTRFDAAQAWLDNNPAGSQQSTNVPPAIPQPVRMETPAPRPAASAPPQQQNGQNSVLYRQFMQWNSQQSQSR